jgi:CHAT domain-containing protein
VLLDELNGDGRSGLPLLNRYARVPVCGLIAHYNGDAPKRIDLSAYRVVYFATHGLVGGEVRGLAEPALVLTLPAEPTDLDDGLLTASEVAQLKLNADWVEALRRAILAYINDTSNPWYAYPDYWAPFSVVGEDGVR